MDTISGVCGECIGRNRRSVRQKRNVIKIIAILVICAVGIYILQYLATSGLLQTTISGVSNKAVQTVQQLQKQIPNLTAQFSAPLQSTAPKIIETLGNLSNTIQQTPIQKPVISISELEQKVHDGINLQRQNQGLKLLVYDTKIADVARKHSQDMATRNYFEHDTPEGITPAQRGINAGYSLCGDRQAIEDSQEYDRLTKQFEATGNTDQSLYNQLHALYLKVESEINNGMIFQGFPENIEQNNLYDYAEYVNGVPFYHWLDEDQLADSIVQTWMGSSGHRHNILTPAYYSEGIGVAIASDDKVYITEDFC